MGLALIFSDAVILTCHINYRLQEKELTLKGIVRSFCVIPYGKTL